MANQPCSCPFGYTEATPGVCTSLIPGLPQLACGTPQGPITQAGQYAGSTVVSGISSSLGNTIQGWIQGALPRVALFLFGLVIIVIGFNLLR